MSRALLLSLILLFCGGVAAEIPIAIVGPMSGPHAWSGEQFRRGARLAVDDVNAAGGILGQKLRLVIGDDAATPAQAVAVADKLAREGLRLVVGHRASDTSLAAQEVYARAGVLQILPSATHPRLTEQGWSTVFRLCGRDDRQAGMAASLLASEWSGRAIGIVHDGSAYGRGLAERTRDGLRRAGGREVLFQAYRPQRSDYGELLERLQGEGVDVLYLGGYSTDAGLIMRQAAERGLALQLIGADALHNADFSLIAGAAAERALFTFDDDPRELDSARDVVARLRAQGYEPEGYTLHTYAAVQAWVAGVRHVGSTEAPLVAAAMRKAPAGTVIGRLRFDAKGDREEHHYRWYQWRDGHYQRYSP